MLIGYARVGEQRRRTLALLQRVRPLQAARQKPLVQAIQIGHLRDRDEELAPRRLHQRLDLALGGEGTRTYESLAQRVALFLLRPLREL